MFTVNVLSGVDDPDLPIAYLLGIRYLLGFAQDTRSGNSRLSWAMFLN